MTFMVYISYCILVNAIVLVSSIILGLLKFVLAKVFGKGMACPCFKFCIFDDALAKAKHVRTGHKIPKIPSRPDSDPIPYRPARD